ncbi:MAG: hypothetical protein VX976_02090 [Pseudomonadota bacterium]|nr:hypothetical protein [Pseudomonadota bacterium]
MTQGLIKSFFLHSLILALFLYGAEIFKENKRFEIYEIPLDVVDISDQTINKVDEPKKKKAKKKKIKTSFQPPKVKSKPTPPEFNIKEKKKKKIKESKKKEPTKEKKQQKRVDSILKSIEKVKSEKKVQKESEIKDDIKKEEKVDDQKEVKNINLGEKLTISEKDAIRRQFYRCWIVPAGAKNIQEYKVSIKLKLNRDGEVINSKLMNKSNLDNPFFRTLAESAIRAVNHPDCKKLKVPVKKYERWKETILDFDPSVMLN